MTSPPRMRFGSLLRVPGRCFTNAGTSSSHTSTEVRLRSGTAFAHTQSRGKPVRQTRRHPTVRHGRIRRADESAFFCLGVKISHVIFVRAADLCRWQSVRHRRSWAASKALQEQRKRVGLLPADSRVRLSLACNPRGAGQAHASRLLNARPKALPQALLRQNHGCPRPHVAPRPGPDRPTTDPRRSPVGRSAATSSRTSADSLGPQSLRDANERSIA